MALVAWRRRFAEDDTLELLATLAAHKRMTGDFVPGPARLAAALADLGEPAEPADRAAEVAAFAAAFGGEVSHA